MLCNTLWSDRRRLITKNKCLLAFSRTSKRLHWSKLSTKKFFFPFLALFREKFRFPAKTFLAQQRSAESFTIYGQTKVYELITKIEWTNQSTRNALSEVENLIIQDICLHRQEIVNIITAQFTEKERSHSSKCHDQTNPTRPVLLRALSFYNNRWQPKIPSWLEPQTMNSALVRSGSTSCPAVQ